MRADNPLAFVLIISLVPLVIAALGSYRRGKAVREALAGTDGEQDGSSTRFFIRTSLAAFFFCLFVVFSVLALAGITGGTEPEPEDLSGLDVVLVLDVSRSMLAQDESPTRLGAATRIARGLLHGLPGSRFAVVAFKGNAIIAVPMTEDRQVLEIFLQNASPAVVNASGSSVESGLALALTAFPPGTASRRAVVLFSDGESHSDFSLRGAQKAETEGVPVFAVGFGSEDGSVIQLPDGAMVTGRDGAPVVTRLAAHHLQRLAELSKGAYFSAREPGLAGRLTERLREFDDARARMGFRLVPRRSYRSFLLAAFVSLCAAVFTRSLKWKKN